MTLVKRCEEVTVAGWTCSRCRCLWAVKETSPGEEFTESWSHLLAETTKLVPKKNKKSATWLKILSSGTLAQQCLAFPVSSPVASNRLPLPRWYSKTAQIEPSLQNARLHNRDQSETAKAKATQQISSPTSHQVPTFHKPVPAHSLRAGCTLFCRLMGALQWLLLLPGNNEPRLLCSLHCWPSHAPTPYPQPLAFWWLVCWDPVSVYDWCDPELAIGQKCFSWSSNGMVVCSEQLDLRRHPLLLLWRWRVNFSWTIGRHRRKALGINSNVN